MKARAVMESSTTLIETDPKPPSSSEVALAYGTLKLPVGASLSQIKQRYKQLAMRHHPDKNIGNDENSKIFDDIAKAYTYLINHRDTPLKSRPGLNTLTHDLVHLLTEYLSLPDTMRLKLVDRNLYNAVTALKTTPYKRHMQAFAQSGFNPRDGDSLVEALSNVAYPHPVQHLRSLRDAVDLNAAEEGAFSGNWMVATKSLALSGNPQDKKELEEIFYDVEDPQTANTLAHFLLERKSPPFDDFVRENFLQNEDEKSIDADERVGYLLALLRRENPDERDCATARNLLTVSSTLSLQSKSFITKRLIEIETLQACRENAFPLETSDATKRILSAREFLNDPGLQNHQKATLLAEIAMSAGADEKDTEASLAFVGDANNPVEDRIDAAKILMRPIAPFQKGSDVGGNNVLNGLLKRREINMNALRAIREDAQHFSLEDRAAFAYEISNVGDVNDMSALRRFVKNPNVSLSNRLRLSRSIIEKKRGQNTG
jgi:hypothetical protein